MAGDDEFDSKVQLPVEAMTKSEFTRWLTEQDSQVNKKRKCLELYFDVLISGFKSRECFHVRTSADFGCSNKEEFCGCGHYSAEACPD